MTTDHICAIDLGTCNSTIAVFANNQVQCIPDSVSTTAVIPSVVTYCSGNIYCGSAAKANSCEANSQVYREVKYIRGRQIKDVRNYKTSCWPFELYGNPIVQPENDNSYPKLTSFRLGGVNGRTTTGYAYPALVDAILLSYMTTIASRTVGHSISDAVITVPASFTESQIYATLEAAELAGLHVLRIVPEPCAAAIEYTEHAFRYVLVFDFGGGTLDTTLMEYNKDRFRILSTAGDLKLGGREIDRLMLRKICKIAEEQGGHIDPMSRKYQRLLDEMENAKIQLSSVDEVTIDFSDYFTIDGDDHPLNSPYTLTRDTFNSWIHDLLNQSIIACNACLEKEGVRLGSEDAILLTGGSSHIPLVREMLKENYKGVAIRYNGNPQEVVARGACKMALSTIGIREPIIPSFSLGLSTTYTTIYSFDRESYVLVREDMLHTVINHCTIHVPSDKKYMPLWQVVNEQPVYIGYVDVSEVAGSEWKVDVSFTRQSLIELKDVEKNVVVPIQYGCATPECEFTKFNTLNPFLWKVRKAISKLEELREYPNKKDVLSLMMKLRGIAADYMFKDVNQACYDYINKEMIPRLEKYSDLYA